MKCPRCHEEIAPGDLLITWYPEGEVEVCWGDDPGKLTEFRSDIKKSGSHLEVDFEHDEISCFHCWRPSQHEIQSVIQEQSPV